MEISQQPQQHLADDVRRTNIKNTLRFWLTSESTPASVIKDVSNSLKQPPKDILIGVHKDSRVKTAHMYDVVFKSKKIRDFVANVGIFINNRRVSPSIPKPRPPPSRRAYLPNFPITATPLHLQKAAKAAGISVMEVKAKTYENTPILIGGWLLWATPNTHEPSTITFDQEEFSIIWPKKKTQTPNNDQTQQEESPSLPQPPPQSRTPARSGRSTSRSPPRRRRRTSTTPPRRRTGSPPLQRDPDVDMELETVEGKRRTASAPSDSGSDESDSGSGSNETDTGDSGAEANSNDLSKPCQTANTPQNTTNNITAKIEKLNQTLTYLQNIPIKDRRATYNGFKQKVLTRIDELKRTQKRWTYLE